MALVSTTLSSRIIRGLGAQGFSQAVQIIIRLVEVPLLLSLWGSQLYGEWLMLAAIPAYLSVCDGGFAGAACREMSIRCGSGDLKGALAVFQSTWLFLLVVSAGIGVIAFVFIEAAPLAHWLGFVQMSSTELKFVFLLLLAHVLFGFQGGLLNGGFWVSGRYPLGMTLQATTQLLEFGGLAAAVALGGGPVQAATGYVGGRLLGTAFVWAGQCRVSPWLHHGFRNVSRDELRHLTGPAFASLAFPLGNAFNIQGMRLIVGLTLGPSAVAVFVPLRTLSRLAMQPRSVINRLIQPELAVAFGGKDTALFQRLFIRSCQSALWINLLACMVLAIAGDRFLPIWTGGKVAVHLQLYILLLSTTAINSFWYTALMVPYATNRHGRIAVFYSLIYGLAAFALGYIGAKFFGLFGTGLALVSVEVVMAAYVIPFAVKLSGVQRDHWLRNFIKPPVSFIWSNIPVLRRSNL